MTKKINNKKPTKRRDFKERLSQEGLKELRMKHNLTVEYSAHMCDVSVITFFRWEGATERKTRIPKPTLYLYKKKIRELYRKREYLMPEENVKFKEITQALRNKGY